MRRYRHWGGRSTDLDRDAIGYPFRETSSWRGSLEGLCHKAMAGHRVARRNDADEAFMIQAKHQHVASSGAGVVGVAAAEADHRTTTRE